MDNSKRKYTHTIKIVIDDIPPSNNEFLGNKKSYHYYGNLKKKWEKLVISSMPEIKQKTPLKNVTIHIHYIFPDKRRRDLDNYSGKFLLDPLVKNKILEDDNYKVINKLILSAESKHKFKKTILEINY